jgi:hypothetical protein
MDPMVNVMFCTYVGGNLVTWCNNKQLVVAKSSVEADFRAMTHGVCEMLWLKILLEELGHDSKDSETIVTTKLQLILLTILSNMIELSMLKLTYILLMKNYEWV